MKHLDTLTTVTGAQDPGHMDSYDATGTYLGGMDYVSVGAQVDAGQPWWLRDETTGENFPSGTTDILDGFQPRFSAPPAGYLQFNLFAGRAGHSLRLRQFPNGFGGEEQTPHRWIDTTQATAWSMTFSDLYGTTFELPVISISTPTDLSNPSDNALFSVVDETTGEEVPGTVELSTWLTPPVAQQVSISSTRYFHDLWLHCANGDEYPVQNGATQGDISWDGNGAAWWNDYGYFVASANRRDGLNYWLIDKTTGESTSSSNADFTNNWNQTSWVSYDAPSNLMATLAEHGGIALSWTGGGYIPSVYTIRRREGSGGSWYTVGTTGNSDTFYTDTSVQWGHTYTYCVRADRSLPSGETTLTYFSLTYDANANGIPDWWEWQYFGYLRDYYELYYFDSDQDGLSDLEEYYRGTNPNDADTDHDGVTDAEEIACGTDPLDPASKPYKVIRSIPEPDQYGHAPNGPVVLYLNKPLPASIASIPPGLVKHSADEGATWSNVSGSTIILPGRKAVAFLPSANFTPRPGSTVAFDYRIDFTSSFVALTPLVPFHAFFSARDRLDTIGPWVRRTWPGRNFIEVAKNFAPVAEWSEPLLPSTVLPSNVSLRARDGTVDLPVAVQFDYDTNHLTITPIVQLLADTRYTVTLLPGLYNLRGVPLLSSYRWSFRTRPDPKPPTGDGPVVTAIQPLPYSSDVETDTTVQITFSEDMDATTLTADTIHLHAYAASADTDALITYNPFLHRVTLAPVAALANQTRYELNFDADAIMSAAATPKPLDGQASFVFTTVKSGGGGGGGGPGGSGGNSDPEEPKPLILAFHYGDDDGDAGGSAQVDISTPDGSGDQSLPLPNASNGTLDYITPEPGIPAGSIIRVTPQFSKGDDSDEDEEKPEVAVTVSDRSVGDGGRDYLVFKDVGGELDLLGELQGGSYTFMYQPASLAAAAAGNNSPETGEIKRGELVIIIPDGSADGKEIDREKKATEGGFVTVNYDDDDNDGGAGGDGQTVIQMDKDDSNGVSPADDDLIWLKIRPMAKVKAAAKFRLKFDDHIKIWKGANKTQPVLSDNTEFPTNQETKLYVEGITPHDDEKGTEITLQFKDKATWHPADHVKIRVAHSIIASFGNGASPTTALETYLDGKVTAKFGEKRLQTASVYTGDAVYLIKGKKDAKDVCYSVRITKSEKMLKIALALDGAYVVYDGHSNWGLGPSFQAGNKRLKDFVNMSSPGPNGTPPSAAIDLWVLRNDPTHPTDRHPDLVVTDDEILTPAKNYTIWAAGMGQVERYRNANGVGIGQAFQIHQEPGSDIKWHFQDPVGSPVEGTNLLIVKSGGDKPVLRYKAFFYNGCVSSLYFGEAFKHGVFLGTRLLVESDETTKIYVNGIIDGKSWGGIRDEMNRAETKHPDAYIYEDTHQ